MALKKRFYYSQNQMQASDFERTLAFTRAREKTQKIAWDYLVLHHSLDTITAKFDVTRQNIYQAVNKLIEDGQIAQETTVKIRRVFNKLNISQEQYSASRKFFFTSNSLDKIAQQTDSTIEDVLKTARHTIKQYKLYANKDDIKKREIVFDKIIPYSRAGEKALKISYDHFVIQDTLTTIAENHEVTTQNVYNTIKRFEEAQARYEAENPTKTKKGRTPKS